MQAAVLIPPCAEYRDSFIEAVKEFQTDSYELNSGGSRYKHLRVADLESNFAAYLDALAEFAAGRNLKRGLVPESTFWLVDGGDFIGRLSVRHYLNDFLERTGGNIGYEIRPSKRRQGYGTLALQLGLQKARELGIARVLITCDTTNTPSRRIIEANGGVFQDVVAESNGGFPKQRFWIDLAGPAPTL